MLSNIAAVADCVEPLVKNHEIWNQAIQMACTDRGPSTRYLEKNEALWVLTNMITRGSSDHVIQVCSGNSTAIDALCIYLEHPRDVAVLKNVLEAIDKILTVDVNLDGFPFLERLDECGGTDYVEKLVDHIDDDISKAAVEILEKVHLATGQHEEENVAPSTTEDGKSYKFGVTTNNAQVQFRGELSSLGERNH